MSLMDQIRGNLRLRLGLVAIVAILMGYGLLEWRDYQAAAMADYRRVLGQIARLAAPQQPLLWRNRAQEASEALKMARGQLWRNSSAGLAQAEVQDWLGALLRRVDAQAAAARVSAPEISIDTTGQIKKLPDALKSLQPLRAKVEFSTDSSVLLGLLAALNDAERRVVVDAMVIKPLRTELTLTFWFEIVDPTRGAS